MEKKVDKSLFKRDLSQNEKVRFTTNISKDILYEMKIYAAKKNRNLNDLIEECFINLFLEEEKKGQE